MKSPIIFQWMEGKLDRERSITDTTTYEGNTVYIMGYYRFYIDEEKTYFWDHLLEEYILYPDFPYMEDYFIKYGNSMNYNPVDSTLVSVDSVYKL